MRLPLSQRTPWKIKQQFESLDGYKMAVVEERTTDGMFRVSCLTCDYEPYDNTDFEVFAIHHSATLEKAMEIARDFIDNG